MEEVIKGVYGTQFGTAYETYQDAVKIDSSIRLQDVKGYVSSRQDRQTHFKYKRYNSFVGPGANFEHEVDLMDLGTDVPEYRYGFIAVDNFTKVASVIPTENKQLDEIIRAIAMGVVLLIQTNIEFINKQHIKHIQTTTRAHTVERFIQTWFNNLYRRINVLNQDKSGWVKHVSSIIGKCNNTVRNTTKITPVGAAKKENHLCVNWHLWNRSTKDRQCPPLSVCSFVRIKVNQKKTTKGHDPTISK